MLPGCERIVSDQASAKMTCLLEILRVLLEHGHRVLVFSQRKIQLDLVGLELHAAGFCFLRIGARGRERALRSGPRVWSDGDTAVRDRQPTVDLFENDPSYHVFLLSTRAGGQGLEPGLR
jgi:SNF2 family DNA or RNA helicase